MLSSKVHIDTFFKCNANPIPQGYLPRSFSSSTKTKEITIEEKYKARSFTRVQKSKNLPQEEKPLILSDTQKTLIMQGIRLDVVVLASFIGCCLALKSNKYSVKEKFLNFFANNNKHLMNELVRIETAQSENLKKELFKLKAEAAKKKNLTGENGKENVLGSR